MMAVAARRPPAVVPARTARRLLSSRQPPTGAEKRRVEMIKASVKVIGIGLLGGALACSVPEGGEPEIAERQGEIRNGTPIPFPRNDSQVFITNGSLGVGSGTLLSQEWVLTA